MDLKDGLDPAVAKVGKDGCEVGGQHHQAFWIFPVATGLAVFDK